MRRQCHPGNTHHEGCPCHEQGWADTATALRRERDEALAEVGRLRALLDRAWDKIPEGYTVLRGEILTALGRPGCTTCGYDCTERPCPQYP